MIEKNNEEPKMKKQIKQKLQELADPKYKEFHGGLCPGTENILGVRVPILRNYAKQLNKQYSLEFLLEEIDDQYYEEIMLQGMLIALEKRENKEILFNKIQEFVPKIDNWAICDVFCAGLKITKKHPQEIWDFIQKYLVSDKEYEVRFAVVIILNYYITEEYLQKDFKIFDEIKQEGYYVKMAVAWAISVCLTKYYEQTIAYLKTSQLDQFTYQKAIQKAIESYRITEEQKQFLRKMKK